MPRHLLGAGRLPLLHVRREAVHSAWGLQLCAGEGVAGVLTGQSSCQDHIQSPLPPGLHVAGVTLGSLMPSPPGSGPSCHGISGVRMGAGGMGCVGRSVRTCVCSPVTAVPSPCWLSCAGVA